jgi:hypothetical protein
MKNKSIKSLVIVIAILALAITIAGCSSSKNIAAGSTWEVAKTTDLSELTIADGAAIKAPEGYSVTMTVNSIGTAINPGTYKGKIVLTVTEEIKIGGMPGGGMPAGGPPDAGAPGGAGGAPGGEVGGMPGAAPVGGAPGGAPGREGGGLPGGEAGGMPGGPAGGASAPFRAAVYVENGRYIAEKSVAALVAEGKVTDTAAENVRITSNEGKFNGIIVTGDSRSTYSITNPVINLTGNGGDDASGLGHGIMASGKAEVTIKNAKITNTGANRSAVFVSGEGIVHVDDSEIETFNGPKEAASSAFSAGGVMMAGPWLLGITGNVRATNIVENGTAYYTNTRIKSQAWGALSTDGPVKVRLYATKCIIETVESGYGAYAIGDCLDYFSGCTFNVVDYGLILCDNASSTFTDATVVNSKRIGVMMHTGTGGGILTIDKGSVFNTRDTVIQIKGRGIDIVVDNAELNSESGVILQSMANDDPFFTSGRGDSMGAKGFSKDVNATFKNMTLKGDIINSYTASSPVNVVFESANITGAITTGTVQQPLGPNGEKLSMQTPELYYLIGQTINTYCAMPEDPYGVSVSLDAKSAWVVDKTSYLTVLTIADGAAVRAPEGYSVTMTVNSVKKPIIAGSYKGNIVLTVTK